MSVRCILSVLISVLLLSCGAATSSMEADDMTMPPTAGQPNGAAKKSPEPQPDKKAEEAATYCEHQVKKSHTAPFEVLNKKQIAACLTALRPQLRTDCAKDAKRQVILKIIIGSDGHVVGAFPVGDGADSAEASCVAEKVKPVTFPVFTGKDQQVIEKYPFDIEP
jgi:hypothetical protein